MRDHLDKLESKSVHILREAYAAFGNLCMLWSIGKDSTVLLLSLIHISEPTRPY